MGASVIRHETLKLPGSPLSGDNPQPFFRQQDLSVIRKPAFQDSFSLGRETGFRVLPYTMQDRYGRELADLEFHSIVMENDFLRACFIPALGGRLWSLFDKKRNREILYRNPVFRPVNLAIRDAWFSGGIEWNIGRLGHAVHTCSQVFAGTFDSGGAKVLRLWEFERQTRLFWRIEFTLPEDSSALYAYVRIENPDAAAKPLYWWTIAAVPQTPGARVFSAANEVIYIAPDTGNSKTIGYGSLPNIPLLADRDASYPALFDYAGQYFFQNDKSSGTAKSAMPWEGAVYEDGYAYGEASTLPLCYRKMFCWGGGRGGRHWQDFLSLPGQEYIELQAGLAPTQLHTADIAANQTVDWIQAFTAFEVEPETAFQKDYSAAAKGISDCLAQVIQPNVLQTALEEARFHTNKQAEIICMGSGWGALEKLRLDKNPPGAAAIVIPQGLSFPAESIGEAEKPWAELLKSGKLPLRPIEAGPGSFMVDENWEPLLAASAARKDDWLTPYHLGVISFEQGRHEEAAVYWEDSLAQMENPWACRNLARAMLCKGNPASALDYYRRALALPGSSDQSFAEEYIPLLLESGKEAEASAALDSYIAKTGSLEALSLPLLNTLARIALNRGNDELLDRIFALEPAHTQDGNTALLELWIEREHKRGHTGDLLPPQTIDFRMYANSCMRLL